jgi:carbamate kinase
LAVADQNKAERLTFSTDKDTVKINFGSHLKTTAQRKKMAAQKKNLTAQEIVNGCAGKKNGCAEK